MSARERKRGPRVVSPDEATLFERAMGEAKLLPDAETPAAPVPPAPPPVPRKSIPVREPALSVGDAAGVDRRTTERLRRGKLTVEAVLDLHGHTQDQAHQALERFVADSATAGRRCVLVITGKGAVSTGGGVLRRQVPIWLNAPALRPHILSLMPAQPQHGGTGAIYVLLRCKRG